MNKKLTFAELKAGIGDQKFAELCLHENNLLLDVEFVDCVSCSFMHDDNLEAHIRSTNPDTLNEVIALDEFGLVSKHFLTRTEYLKDNGFDVDDFKFLVDGTILPLNAPYADLQIN